VRNLYSPRWPLLLALIAGVVIVIALTYLPSKSSGVQHPASGGRYVEGVAGAPAKINPLFANFNEVDADLSSLVFSGLVRLGPNGGVQPDLADLPTIAPDGRTYVFRLKDGLVWQDGKPITSADVIFTVRMIQDADFNGDPQLAALFRGVDVEAFGPAVAVMILPEPYAPFLSRGAVAGILPEHLLGGLNGGQLGDAPFNQAPVGSGPFQLEQLTPESALLRRFDRYHEGAPYLDEIELRFYPDDAALLSALTQKEISGALFRPGLDKRAINAIDDDSKLVRRSLHTTTYSVVYLNTLVPVFSDDRVRRALQHGLDRTALIDAVLEGQAVPLDSPIVPNIWSYIGAPDAYAYDKSLAESLLDQAGWKLDGDVRKNADGALLRFHLEASDDPVQVAVGQEIARQWAELGAQVDVVVSGASQFVEGVLLPRQFHSALVSIDPGPDPDPYPFWHSTQAAGQGRNLASFADSAVDQLLENARQTTSAAERAVAYRQFQQVFAQLVAAVLLYTPSYQYVVDADVKGISPGLLLSPALRFRDIQRWYIETSSDGDASR
jgi:peptide/nickel transport system substrate-binding protein